jgi:hypothetical protein
MGRLSEPPRGEDAQPQQVPDFTPPPIQPHDTVQYFRDYSAKPLPAVVIRSKGRTVDLMVLRDGGAATRVRESAYHWDDPLPRMRSEIVTQDHYGLYVLDGPSLERNQLKERVEFLADRTALLERVVAELVMDLPKSKRPKSIEGSDMVELIEEMASTKPRPPQQKTESSS